MRIGIALPAAVPGADGMLGVASATGGGRMSFDFSAAREVMATHARGEIDRRLRPRRLTRAGGRGVRSQGTIGTGE
jgi:hypothetical protein